MPFELPPLPYAENALEPHVSATTIGFHHGKHHAAYVAGVNRMVEGTHLAGRSLEEVILASDGRLFDNAAQVWNHDFYWKSMSPDGGGDPSGALARAVEESFGSADQLRKELAEAAVSHFGSGWAWLVAADDGLEITTTSDADLPLRHGSRALLTIDVWEHAYYLDHQNRRAEYVSAFLEHLVNWEFVEANLVA